MIATLLARDMLRADFQSSWYTAGDNVARYVVYSERYTKPIWLDGEPTTETRRQADLLFDRYIKTAASYKAYKEQEKRNFFYVLVHAAKRALYYKGSVVYSREIHRNSKLRDQKCGDNDPRRSGPGPRAVYRIDLQVIACACESGLFSHYLSPPGSPKMSRLLPTQRIAQYTEIDPWTFDPPRQQQYVFLRDRATKQDITFDQTDPVAKKYQRRLTKINKVNAKFPIFYQPLSEWSQDFDARRQLRPVHYALFTDTFHQHGRIYTSKYGQQALRKLERNTLEFETGPHTLEKSVELDYGGLHPRLAYHLSGIDYQSDPYKLWPKTTDPMRLMAKVMINAALNAKSADAAISDCNRAMSIYRKDRKTKKSGKALADAIALQRAANVTGLKFKDIYTVARSKHQRIAAWFASDAGMRLMRLDSEIALRIMHHFAKQGIPCLGVHDSFLVPQSAASELRRVMRVFYRQKVGFNPIIK